MTARSINDEGFRERVEKTFGNLLSSSSAASAPPEIPCGEAPALWSLTDKVVEKREWRRDKSPTSSYDRDSTPCSSSFDELVSSYRNRSRRNRSNNHPLEDDLEDLDVDDDGQDREVWEIRSTIGLDPTLDHEEEEDAYDKVATGRENAGDRFYMADIRITHQNQHDSQSKPRDYNFHSSFGAKRSRDPHANNMAAGIRLEEDEDAPPPPSEETGDQLMPQGLQHLTKQHQLMYIDGVSSSPSGPGGGGGGGTQVKPILKRKDHETDTGSKSQKHKRVRFDPSCNFDASSVNDGPSLNTEAKTYQHGSSSALGRQVPDYLLNPSKYACYSLETTKLHDDPGDFLKLVKDSRPLDLGFKEDEDPVVTPPRSVAFIPKKSSTMTKAATDANRDVEEHDSSSSNKHPVTAPICIAAGSARDGEVNDMDIDEPETGVLDKCASLKKPGRQYRVKSCVNESESV